MKYLLLILFPFSVGAQTFSEVVNSTTGSFPSSNFYGGAAWVDFDNDGDLDLSLSYFNSIYVNDGTGNFEVSEAFFDLPATMKGVTWADYDNDGFIDAFFSGANNHGPKLYKNNGGLDFTEVTSPPFDEPLNLRGWGASWGDLNNDAFVDLLIAAPVNFAQIPSTQKNTLLINSNGEFTSVTTTPLTEVSAAYTIPTFYDYDDDLDVDVFIGSGPITATGAPDKLYENTYSNSSQLSFQEITASPMGTDFQDGQVWNFIDVDNDGDYDAFLTNYGLGFNCRLYINNGMGDYAATTSAQAGSIVSTTGKFLSNSWGDYDNDGDLDVILTRDQGVSLLYLNDGNGFFLQEDNAFNSTDNFTATNGDYNADGYLDVFLSGRPGQVSLYENQNSGNNWVKFNLNGNSLFGESNNSALGTKVRIWATIDGIQLQQTREINAQNTFNGMNALEVHFGLKQSPVIDSVSITWPDGQVRSFTNLSVNQTYNLTQGTLLLGDNHELKNDAKTALIVYPNPVNNELRFDLMDESEYSYAILTMESKVVIRGRGSSEYLDVSSLNTGTYILELNFQETKRSGFFIKN